MRRSDPLFQASIVIALVGAFCVLMSQVLTADCSPSSSSAECLHQFPSYPPKP